MEIIAVDLDDVVCIEHQPELLADAEYCLKTLKNFFRLEVVTARNPHRREATLKWIESSLPDVFDDIHFNRDYKGRVLTKADVCLDIGATYLIDNLDEHCSLATEVGVTAIQFGSESYPQWEKILEYFLAKTIDM